MTTITPVAVELTFKVAVITSSVDRVSVFVAMINFVLADIIINEAVMVSLVGKITLVVTDITFLGTDIGLLVAKITYKVAVITSSVVKITLVLV